MLLQVAVTWTQKHLSSPQGGSGSSTSSHSAHVTCALRAPQLGGRWAEDSSSLGTPLPSPTEPGGLILALAALALSLLARIFCMHHNKVLCFNLAGYFTKMQRGWGEHKSELETHQRREPPWRGPPSTTALGKYVVSPPPEAPGEGTQLTPLPPASWGPSVGCSSAGVSAPS